MTIQENSGKQGPNSKRLRWSGTSAISVLGILSQRLYYYDDLYYYRHRYLVAYIYISKCHLECKEHSEWTETHHVTLIIWKFSTTEKEL